MTPVPAAAPNSPLATALAPAKVNLYLRVTGRRDDGYHLLDSLVAFAGVGDEIELRPHDSLTLEVAGPYAPALDNVDDNLAMRAARLLREAANVRAGARIRLIKHLPVAAGIGGGSSDAAAVLRALGAFWDARPRDAVMARIALALGADVPVCLARRAALVGGIGERLAPAPPLPRAFLVLANPGKALSTARVFAALGGRFGRPVPREGRIETAADLAAAVTTLGNDLEAPARELVPAIGAVLDDLAGEPGCLAARMSGSGPTCFGLFAEPGEASRAASRIAARRPDWWVAAAPLLERFEDQPSMADRFPAGR